MRRVLRFVGLVAALAGGCGEPVTPPGDGGASGDVALRPVGDAPAAVGAACVATVGGPCGPASPPCCTGFVCQRDVCLRALGEVCQFPWECATAACLLPAATPGASRCATP